MASQAAPSSSSIDPAPAVSDALSGEFDTTRPPPGVACPLRFCSRDVRPLARGDDERDASSGKIRDASESIAALAPRRRVRDVLAGGVRRWAGGLEERSDSELLRFPRASVRRGVGGGGPSASSLKAWRRE